jgi:hypothetical protein
MQWLGRSDRLLAVCAAQPQGGDGYSSLRCCSEAGKATAWGLVGCIQNSEHAGKHRRARAAQQTSGSHAVSIEWWKLQEGPRLHTREQLALHGLWPARVRQSTLSMHLLLQT